MATEMQQYSSTNYLMQINDHSVKITISKILYYSLPDPRGSRSIQTVISKITIRLQIV